MFVTNNLHFLAMKPTQHHAKLKKTLHHRFAAPSLALLGSNKPLMQRFIEHIAQKLHVAIVRKDDSFFRPQSLSNDIIWVGQSDHFSEIKINTNLDERQLYHLLADYELIFHFEQNEFAQQAIVFGKSIGLTNVLAICEGEEAEGPLFFEAEELDALTDFVLDWTLQKAAKTPIYGLVLAGGLSSRMQKDKGSLEYHEGITQRQWGYQLLQKFCSEVYISCREEQIKKMEYPYLKDKFLDLGPLSGLLSAFQHAPDAAWLVMACDMPLLNERTLLNLVENRNPLKIATAYYNQERKHPEPLLTIWEPRAYRIILDALGRGETCPRHILQNSDYQKLIAIDTQELQNVNTQEDHEAILKKLERRSGYFSTELYTNRPK